MKCFLDVDGVLANFVEGVCVRFEIDNPYAQKEMLGNWDFMHLIPNYQEKADVDFWSSLPLMPDAHDLLNLIEKKYGYENICLLTSPGSIKNGNKRFIAQTVEGKLNWIDKHFPRYINQSYVGKAKHYCANQKSTLIDDADHNVEDFQKHGGKTILVPRPWNSLYEHSYGTVDYLKLLLGW